MKSRTPSREDIDRLPPAQRRLVEQVMRSCQDGPETGLPVTAERRLRNIVEKYSEELKRARLDMRSGGCGSGVADLQSRLAVCTQALETCRRTLAAIDGDG